VGTFVANHIGMGMLWPTSSIIFAVIFLFPARSAFAQISQTCSQVGIQLQSEEEKCDIIRQEKSQAACYDNCSKRVNQVILSQFTLYLENEKTAVNGAKEEGDYIRSEGATKEILRIKAAQQNWEIYRKLQCEVEDGASSEWASQTQAISYNRCLYRINLSRFAELCTLNEVPIISKNKNP